MGERNEERESVEYKAGRARRIIDAALVIENELRYQVGRMSNYVQAKTDEERLHHEDLLQGYGKSEIYVGRLRRYQEGRLRRLLATGDAANVPDDDEAFDGGVPSPYLDERDAV